MKLPKFGNMMKGNQKYYTIGGVALAGILLTAILKKAIKPSMSTARVHRSMAARASKAYAMPALASDDLGLGNNPGGNWLAVPYQESKHDKYMLNRLPTYSTNVVGFPLNENNMKFIGGTGFGNTCDQGKFGLAPNPVV